MKIRLFAVPTEYLPSVHIETDLLRRAVDAGNMEAMDAITEKLTSLSNQRSFVDLSEEEWKRVLKEIRAKDQTYQSDYLVPGKYLQRFFSGDVSGATLLQLPIEEK